MVKEISVYAKRDEVIAGAKGSSQYLIGKLIKPAGTLDEDWEDTSEGGEHDLIMSHRWGHVQCDGWRFHYKFVVKVDKENFQ